MELSFLSGTILKVSYLKFFSSFSIISKIFKFDSYTLLLYSDGIVYIGWTTYSSISLSSLSNAVPPIFKALNFFLKSGNSAFVFTLDCNSALYLFCAIFDYDLGLTAVFYTVYSIILASSTSCSYIFG